MKACTCMQNGEWIRTCLSPSKSLVIQDTFASVTIVSWKAVKAEFEAIARRRLRVFCRCLRRPRFFIRLGVFAVVGASAIVFNRWMVSLLPGRPLLLRRISINDGQSAAMSSPQTISTVAGIWKLPTICARPKLLIATIYSQLCTVAVVAATHTTVKNTIATTTTCHSWWWLWP